MTSSVPLRALSAGALLVWLCLLTTAASAAEVPSNADLYATKPLLPAPTLLNDRPLDVGKNPDGSPADVMYKSPQPIIRREATHLVPPPSARVAESDVRRNLADLVPSAGAMMDPTPLIPVPGDESAKQTAPLPQTAEPAVPAPATPNGIAVPLNESNYDAAALDAMIQNLPDPGAPKTADAPVASAGQPTSTEPMIPVPQQPAAEPQPVLSDASKNVINKFPAGMGPEVPMPKDINIDHAKDTGYVSGNAGEAAPPPVALPETGAEQEEVSGNPAMGIKFHAKKSAVNLDYELEKAYNALMSGRSEEAVQIYKSVLSNDGNNKLALFGLATTYHRAGQLDMARPLYAKLLAIDPGNRDALNNFLVLIADEAPQEALMQMERLEQKNPGFSPIPAQMAVIYQKLGNTDIAIQKMFKASALSPENLTYQYNLAILLDTQKRYGEAIKIYKQLMQAHMRGEIIPGDPLKIQERLTFISSNRS